MSDHAALQLRAPALDPIERREIDLGLVAISGTGGSFVEALAPGAHRRSVDRRKRNRTTVRSTKRSLPARSSPAPSRPGDAPAWRRAARWKNGRRKTAPSLRATRPIPWFGKGAAALPPAVAAERRTAPRSGSAPSAKKSGFCVAQRLQHIASRTPHDARPARRSRSRPAGRAFPRSPRTAPPSISRTTAPRSRS